MQHSDIADESLSVRLATDEILRITIKILLAGALAAVFVLHLTSPGQPLRDIAPLLVAFVAATSGWLIRRGHPHMAARLLVWGTLTAVTGIAVFTGGVQAPLIITYPVIIMMAGWLLHVRGAQVAAILAAGASCALAAAEIWGLLPTALPATALLFAGDQLIVYLLSAILISFLVRAQGTRMVQLRRAMQDAAHQAQELRTQQAELMNQAAELEMQNEELQRAKLALDQERARYVDLFDSAPVGYCTLSADGLIQQVNLTVAGSLGLPRAALIGQRLTRFVLPEDQDILYLMRRQLVDANQTQRRELRMLRSDGTVFWAQLLASWAGSMGALRVVLGDITARKQAEAASRIAAVAFESQQGMMVTDANNVILQVNQAFTRISGYSAAEVVGKTPSMLQSGRHDAEFYRQLWRSLRRSDSWQGEIWDKRKNGEVYPKWLAISVVRAEDGSVSHYIGTHHEITERKKAEVDLLNLNHDLAESRQSLRELAAQNEASREGERKHIAREVHDELGQVLTALRMEMSMLGMRLGVMDPAVSGQLVIMKALLDGCIQAVRNVATNLRPAALDMGLIPAIEWLCSEFTSRGGIACSFHASEENIEVDETRAVVIFRIVQESLTNVTRYAGASQVQVSMGRNGNQLGVEVRDDGRGFDPRAAALRKSFGLLGMRERAISIGGHLDVVSAPDQGTVIGLSAPITLNVAKETS
jgi:PAS domain S-box-containing protein